MARPKEGYGPEGKWPGVSSISKMFSDVESTDVLMGWVHSLARNKKADHKFGALAEPPCPSCGVRYINYKKATEHAADAGTAAHEYVENFLRYGDSYAKPVSVSKDVAAIGYGAFLKWKSWFTTQSYEVVELETKMEHSHLRFGGTPDALVKRAGLGSLVLMDWKTGSNVYQEVLAQLAGYILLYDERQMHVRSAMVVHFSRDGQFNLFEWTREQLYDYIDEFKSAARIHHMRLRGKEFLEDGRISWHG